MSKANGAVLQIWNCGGPQATNELWTLNPITTAAGQGYQVVSVNSGSCLDVRAVSSSNGALVQQWQCLGATQLNQVWQLFPYGSGYELMSLNSGLCLDLSGGVTANGNQLQQWSCGNGYNPNQIWSLVPVSNAPTAAVATNSIPASLFGMTVLNFSNVSSGLSFGTTRTWDAYPNLDWSDVNPAPGVYNFQWLDSFIQNAQAANADVIYTFGRTPQWASSQPWTPTTYGFGQCAPPSNLQNWQNYVTAIVTHANGRIKYWELWNEPQDPGYYCGDIPTMVTMAQQAYSIIKSIDPSAQVITPSVTSTAGPAWLNSYLAAGGGQYADVMSFHGYWSPVAEDINGVINRYQAVYAANNQQNKPIFDTEGSWSGILSRSLIDPNAQAAFVAKYYLLQYSGGVQRFVWYAYDGGVWGPLWTAFTGPTAGAQAYSTVEQWMVGATLSSPCAQDQNSTWTCGFTRPGGYNAVVVWNSSQTVNYPVPAGLSDYRTLTNSASPVNGQPTLQVSNSPLLIESSEVF